MRRGERRPGSEGDVPVGLGTSIRGGRKWGQRERRREGRGFMPLLA